MSDLNRRDAVKLAAGLAVGASVLAAPEARSQESKKGADAKSADLQLERADSLAGWLMLYQQVTFQTDGNTLDLWITSARDQRDGGNDVRVRLGTMRVFRPDTSVDDFTKKGGVYWKCGKAEGKLQFKEPAPGALVMVVRELDGTVRCFLLLPDFRC